MEKEKSEEKVAKKHVTVSLPIGLLDDVDKVIRTKRPKYVSRADFCRVAVHRLLKEERKQNRIGGNKT